MKDTTESVTNGKQEIVELKRVETALPQAERMLTTLISNLPGFVYRCTNDDRWTMLYVSEGCLQITGYWPSDFINNRTLAFSDIIHPNYRNWKGWQSSLESGGHIEDEYPITTASGEIRWVWERGRGVFNDDGKLLYIEGFITDITERKQAEQRLANSEEQYRHLFELSPVAILIEDLKGTILEVNSAYVQVSGYNREELIGQNVRMFVAPENHHLVDQHIAMLEAGATLEHEVASVDRDGEKRVKMLRERAIPLANGELGILSLATDRTERKKAEEALLRSEKKYRNLVERMLDGMAIANFSGQVLLWNPAGLKIFGIDPTDIACLYTATVFDFIHPNFVDKVRGDIELIYRGQDVTSEFQVLRKGGEVGWLEAHATKIDYEGSEAFLVLMRDITERKREEAFKEFLSSHDPLTNLYNRRYFEKIMTENNISSPGIIVVDLDGLKIINDTLGHSHGDDLLKVTAKLLQECAPPGAVVARIGGDEFAVIASVTPEQVDAIVLRIREARDKYTAEHPELPLSLSCGYGVASGKVSSLYDLFKEADNYMYRRKLFHQKSSRSILIHALMNALESKNLETKEHVERIGELAVAMARRIGYPENKVIELHLFARFHDVGKVGIADSILAKPGPLTPAERTEMERHCEIGYRIASASPELAPIADLILKHQEWWNGQGYPLGLKEADIPLECRIVSIVDAFDAMTSDRPYRKALTKEAAIAELRRCSGVQFDPGLVEAFVQVIQ